MLSVTTTRVSVCRTNSSSCYISKVVLQSITARFITVTTTAPSPSYTQSPCLMLSVGDT
jgi:hypothetical protein